MIKVKKYLWYSKESGEVIVKQYSPTLRALSLFSANELIKAGGEQFFSTVAPIPGTETEFDEVIELVKGRDFESSQA